jgi:eukaryotic-like serine/threonine-protein kinase
MTLIAGTRLGPYELLGQIGAGGMGQVYRARDTRLGRMVAVKVLPPDVAGSADRRERFDREARAVASLSHPHICALFDVGLDAGTPYLVMEYVPGETLAGRLARGSLPPDEALPLGAQIADALAAAHAQGIVHRDLKPANIVITSAGAKVLDFGLAKSVSGGGADRNPHESPTVLATAGHVILGTAAYMSPEQARGSLLDHRTDAWSFGVVLYEMLTGRRPHDGATVADVISAVLHATPDWSALPPGLPPVVTDLLRRLLERDVDRRAGDMSQVARQLAGEVSNASHTPAGAALADTAANGIVVLPFANLSADPDNEYFSDGLTEEIIADLSRIGALRVISRTTAMRLKGSGKALRELATELSVRYALEGSVRKAGTQLRMTTQLIDTRSDATLWSGKYKGTLDDVFAIQEEVSRAIVESLRVTLTPTEERKLAAPATRSGYAYDIYLRARRDIWGFTKEGIDRARASLEQAVSVVGDNVLLYKGLGLAWWMYVNAGHTADAGHLDTAETYARRILELEPGSAHGSSLLGFIALQRGDIASWVRHTSAAYRADPTDPDHGTWLGLGWAWAGFPHRATTILEQQLTVDPYSAYVLFGLGGLAWMDGRYDAAIELYRRAARLFPEHAGLNLMICQAHASKGNLPEVLEALDASSEAPESSPMARLGHILKFAALGRADAVDRLDSAEFRAAMWSDAQYTHAMAQAYAMLGRTDEALRWLERSFERGTINYPFISTRDPLLASIRPDPRFAALMRRMKAKWEGFEEEIMR